MLCENSEFIRQEYLELVRIVAQFDDRFMTIKGWAVTFSLGTLALAYQNKITGLFLVAVLSAMSFWALETSMKVHQSSYYPRMRQIEVICYHKGDTAPGIDWAWNHAEEILTGKTATIDGKIIQKRKAASWVVSYFGIWSGLMWLPHIFLPHLITILLGAVFLIRDWRNVLPSKESR